MLKRTSTRLLIGIFIVDMALTLAAVALARAMRINLPFGAPVVIRSFKFGAYVYIITGIVWAGIFGMMGIYDIKKMFRAVEEIQNLLVAIALAVLVLAGLAYFFFYGLSRILFFYFVTLDTIFLVTWRLLLRAVLKYLRSHSPYPAQRVLIIGGGGVGCNLAARLSEYSWAGAAVVGFLDDDPRCKAHQAGYTIFGGLYNALRIVDRKNIDAVAIALPLSAHQKMARLIVELEKAPVRVFVIPDFFALAFFQATIEDFAGMPVIGLREPAIGEVARFVKRVFDLAIAASALIFTSPIMAIIAIAIKRDSKGPVIFAQVRAGENGKLFKMYKFRTMVQDAEKRLDEVIKETKDGEIIYKTEDDPRVTKVGKFLRRSSLDELPQLWNVLRGEMSLVGPRPELPWLVDCYEPWQRRRFAVPQGITGWWQISGRSDKPMHLHTEDDIYYIKNYSLLLDLQILWKTVWAVFEGKGAY